MKDCKNTKCNKCDHAEGNITDKNGVFCNYRWSFLKDIKDVNKTKCFRPKAEVEEKISPSFCPFYDFGNCQVPGCPAKECFYDFNCPTFKRMISFVEEMLRIKNLSK